MDNSKWQQIRNRRLYSDNQRLKALANNSPFISIESSKGDPPYEYVVRYACKGVAGLGVLGPIYSEDHRVLIQLQMEYPTKQPLLRWLTPIFHPNINNLGTHVCIDVWYPSKFLDDLCIMLGRMIQYQNYNPYNPLRRDVASWCLVHAHLLPVDNRPLQRGISGNTQSEKFEIKFLED